MKNTHLILAAAVVVAITAMPSARAATLVNFSTGTLIDRPGGQEVDVEATGSTPESTLEATSGLRVINDFRQSADATFGGGFLPDPASTTPNNFFVFTGASTNPDIRITQEFNFRSNSGSVTGGGAGTDPNGEAMNIVNNNIGNIVFSITFGTFDFGADGIVGGSDDNADSFAANVFVNAAGFTLSNIPFGNNVTAVFRNLAGTAISTQTASGTADGTTNTDLTDVYFGLVDSTNGIGSITITRGSTATNQTSILGDLAFTAAIPEPSTFAMLLGGLGLLVLRRRRA